MIIRITGTQCYLIALILTSLIGTSSVQAQVDLPSPGEVCQDLTAYLIHPESGGAFPLACLSDSSDPVPQSGTPLRQLIRTATLLFPTPLSTALPGGLWFSLSGESDVEVYGIVRRRAGSAGAVPALRLREP